MLVDTYHENLSDKRKIRQSKPSKLLLTLTESEKITTPPQSTEFYTIKDVMPNHKEDDEDDIPRENVERFIAQLANLGTDSVVTIPDVLWSSLDLDDDDIFNSTEWKIASQRMQTKSLFLEPIIVFPSISARRHHQFTTKMMDGKLPTRDRCENFVLYRTSSSAAPSSATDWRSLRKDVFAYADITAASHCRRLKVPPNHTSSVMRNFLGHSCCRSSSRNHTRIQSCLIVRLRPNTPILHQRKYSTTSC